MERCLFLSLTLQLSGPSVLRYRLPNVVRRSDQAMVFFRDLGHRVVGDSSLNVASMRTPDQRFLGLQGLQVKDHRFEGAIRLNQYRSAMDMMKVAASKEGGLSVLRYRILGLVFQRSGGTNK